MKSSKESARTNIVSDLMRKAQMEDDRKDVQAARRCLTKRGIDWRTGETTT
jgi:hypothetical protein